MTEPTYKAEPIPKDISITIAESVGQAVGKVTLLPLFNQAEKIAATYTIQGEYSSLSELKGTRPAIVAANHIGPVAKEKKFIKTSGVTPDVFIIQSLVHTMADRKPLTVAINEAQFSRKVMHGAQRIKEALGRGFVRGAGMLPVNKQLTKEDEKKLNNNKEFMIEAEQKLKENNILTFFVEGRWRRPQDDLSEKIKVESGAVRAAKAVEEDTGTEVPIIPVYIHCSDEWDKNKKAYVYSGKPIYAAGRHRLVVQHEIEQSLIELQKKAALQNPGLLQTIVRP